MLVSIRESLAFACFCRVLHLKKPFKLLWALASWMELRTGESWFMNWIQGTNWCSPSMFKEFQRVAVAILFIPFASFCSFSFQDLTEAQAKSLLECLGLGHAWSTVQYYPDLSSTCISKMFKDVQSKFHVHDSHRLTACLCDMSLQACTCRLQPA